MKFDIYQMVTDRIIDSLNKGIIPWRKPWKGGSVRFPVNAVSRKQYTGANVFLLACAPYSSNIWMTYNQAKSLGGNVRKGEHSWPVVFYKISENPNKIGADGKPEKYRLLRYYSVFNLEQTENVTLHPSLVEKPEITTPAFNPIPRCEEIWQGMPNKPTLVFRAQRACYSPAIDVINMPAKESFDAPEFYYSTLFHEATHATGHPSRLNRKGETGTDGSWESFGSTSYAREELVAEMGAAFLCAHAGIDVAPLQENTTAYIQDWLTKLRNDKSLVTYAGAKAQKAANYILNVQESDGKEETEETAQAA